MRKGWANSSRQTRAVCGGSFAEEGCLYGSVVVRQVYAQNSTVLDIVYAEAVPHAHGDEREFN